MEKGSQGPSLFSNDHADTPTNPASGAGNAALSRVEKGSLRSQEFSGGGKHAELGLRPVEVKYEA